MRMLDEIGKVKLDYGRYPGEDFYCDGTVEDELLEIVKTYSQTEYKRVIEERRSWPVLYHLSELRENIIDWIPMKKTDKVLEVGSGCGAITGALARKAGSVTCVDLSKKRSLINAYRNSACDNVTIHVGNFKDIEPELPKDFDYICLIGVFEYGQAYIGGNAPYQEFLNILLPHLAAGGRIVIAIENKYGLKYFAGCREDHLGTWFSGIENYAEGGGVRTFSRRGLEKIFRSCGVQEYHFYYPYPDYKFMTSLYSDAYLPGKGELTNNLRNFDRDRMLLFDEKNAFDGISEDGLFPIFSNSFLAVIGGDFEVKYVKYSNDRAPEFAIRTQIGRSASGEISVRKYPMTEAAKAHIRGMKAAYDKLSERYRGGRLEISRCELTDNAEECFAQFAFVQGTPLTELMDNCLEREDTEGFYGLFREYLSRTGYNSEMPVADFDLIFANILVEQDRWTLIDYEWTFDRAIEPGESAFRAVYCYLMEDERRNRLQLDTVLRELQITEKEAEDLRARERAFQDYVTGKRAAMTQLHGLLGRRSITPQKWIEKYEDSGDVNRVQIYEDRGKGYSEEESYFVKEAYQGENLIEMELKVSGDVRKLRIDPAFDSCIVRILELRFNGEEITPDRKKVLAINGRIAKPATLIFPTIDPNINVMLSELYRKAENVLSVRLEIVRVPLSMTKEMADAVKRIL